MARAPFNVLVIPYRRVAGAICEYAVFRRAGSLTRQFIAGGGENDEKPMVAARREALEEAGIARCGRVRTD
jgi:dihydroneopterin triphosphate diphosphatase